MTIPYVPLLDDVDRALLLTEWVTTAESEGCPLHVRGTRCGRLSGPRVDALQAEIGTEVPSSGSSGEG